MKTIKALHLIVLVSYIHLCCLSKTAASFATMIRIFVKNFRPAIRHCQRNACLLTTPTRNIISFARTDDMEMASTLDDKDSTVSFYSAQMPSTSTTTKELNITAETPPDIGSTTMIQSHVESAFATHVLITKDEAPITVLDIVSRVLSSISSNNDKTELSAIDLIHLGSVWYLPSSDVEKHGTYNPSSGVKPIRLMSPYVSINNHSNDNKEKEFMILQAGDYLRIHHNPRRFRMVNDYDWNCFSDETTLSSDGKENVIVATDVNKGWMVVNKPAGIPVHMTVDNAIENVASCIETSLISTRRDQTNNSNGITETVASNDEDKVYVATPQRLDQNTSGLLVVATKKLFASYFAQLLRYKTAELLIHYDNNEASAINPANIGGINKLYRYLVCILSPNYGLEMKHLNESQNADWSIETAEMELQSYVSDQRVMRHFLEPSIRAPKRFVLERPQDQSSDSDEIGSVSSSSSIEWPEALLKIRKASRVYAVSGDEAATNLAQSLWTSTNTAGDFLHESINSHMPDLCKGVMELEIELLTGRTHQIRGQLAACNFPLVGDVQYGGAKQPLNAKKNSLITERLALQCCTLEFIDPDIEIGKTNRDGTLEYKMSRSQRWNRFNINTAWWTPYLREFEESSIHNVTTKPSSEDVASTDTTLASDGIGQKTSSDNINNDLPRPDLLPPRVSLARGSNKYVLIRAVHPLAPTQEEWFVKSATTTASGGSYHGNVAQDLREWIEAVGYEVTVTGGGRIKYQITSEGQREAIIYGFSYGFGRADHTKAATIIRDWSNGEIVTFVDNSASLY